MRKIFYGGDILTLTDGPQPEAIWVEDESVRQVGKLSDMPMGGRVDLRGAALLPAFIDAHSHITACAQTMGLAPLEGANGFADLQKRLRAFIAADRPDGDRWVTGFGYDHNAFLEKRHPDRFVLDEVSADRPVLITHQSGHMGVLNSKALSLLGITSQTPDPEGGRIGRLPGSREPSGYLEETAFTQLTGGVPQPTLEDLLSQLDRAQDEYLKYGVATAQDGITRTAEWALLQRAADAGRLKMDVVSYVDMKLNPELLAQNPIRRLQYQNRLKIGGYKIFLDGSPQGRTAWMSAPYEDAPDGYLGYPVYDDAQVAAFFERAQAENVQILVHCNGDAAAQQMIDCYAQALARGKNPIRPVMIHAQLLRPDQMAAVKALGIIPSFFVAHTWHWGDVHLKNFGPERARQISPARSALAAGLPFTFHQDAPVIAPDMLETIFCAVNHVSKAGADMGAAQRISPLDAIKAVTVNAAHQYFEEGQKGRLAPGFKADLCILDQNPLTCDPQKLRDIRVLETLIDGETAYEAQA